MDRNGMTDHEMLLARDGGKRAAYSQGLRALADLIDNHDEIPLPYDGNGTPMTMHFLHGADPRTAMAAAAKVIPCHWRKNVRSYENDDSYFDLLGELAGLKVKLTAYRDAVCERVVTGTREVTEKVKDPDALAAVPEVEVTKVVEDVEWRCNSILAPKPESPVAA